jgi:hypothetical protein
MDESVLEPLEVAILRTLLYADVFAFPMTVRELHHFLIHDRSASLNEVEEALANSSWLEARLCRHNGYVAVAGRDELIAVRDTRERVAQQLWPRAVRYGRWLAWLPFVRMVALTGALAVRNAPAEDDDFDYLIVAASARVWTARAFAILLVRVARLFGAEVCPNYVVAESALAQERRNVFIAHEIAQMVPVYHVQVFERVRDDNRWMDRFLPNAIQPFYDESREQIGALGRIFKTALEALLGGRLGDKLEQWEYRRKLKRFAQALQADGSAAQLDAQRVKGHFEDHGQRVLTQFQKRLQCNGIPDGADFSGSN